MDIPKKIRQIKQHIRGMGVQPAVIDAVDMLCDLIEELADVQVPVPEVQEEVHIPTSTEEVLEPELPIEEDTGRESTNNKPETAEGPERKRNEMSKDGDSPKVISSAAEAAETIKKEKKKKQDMLDKIFSDNKTGRYSGPTDS